MYGKINGRTIDIVDAGKGQLKKYSEITLEKEYAIQEFLYKYRPEETGGGMSEKNVQMQTIKKQVGTAVRQQTKTAAVTYTSVISKSR